MCAQENDCGAQASCVAGRCVARGATPAIDSGRRMLFAPVDEGYVRRNGPGRDARLATFGRAGEHGIVFLRFSLALPPEADVLEAYLLLDRAPSVDADGAPLALHAARVVSAWDGRSVSWATQPRIEEVGAPVTRVALYASPRVRLDVRDIVQRWRRRERDDFGVAILCEGESVTGVVFALASVDGARDGDDPVLAPPSASAQPGSPFESRAASFEARGEVGDSMRRLEGPRLEVYVQ
jgi:hypothetical protein